MDNKGALFTIFLIVAIGLLGFGLYIPLFPYLAESLGASAFQIGMLSASYSAAQLVGAPLLGRASDRFGRRPILLLSIAGTIASFLILVFAKQLWVIYASRILDGFTGGNISVAAAYITDVTDRRTRARGLGLIGAAFGVGFVFGPAVGGLLSEYGFGVPALAAAGLSLVSFLGVIFFLPESLTPEQRAELARKARQEFLLTNLRQALQRCGLGTLLNIRFLYGLAFATFQTMFPLYSQQTLLLSARQTGYVLAYVGLLVALVQGVGIGWVTSRFSERRLLWTTSLGLGLSLFAWAASGNVWMLLAALAPLAAFSGVLNTVLNSSLTKVVYPEEVGGTLGLSASLESLTRTIAPALGGYLFGALGGWSPGVLGGLLMLVTAGYAWHRLVHRSEVPDGVLEPC